MENKTVVITGGGTGIGRATALAFTELGARVVVVGRRAHLLTGGTPVVADLTGPDAPQRVVEQVLERFGGLDVLVNNAAVARGPAVVETNLLAPHRLYEAARAELVRSKGVVVNVSTAVGQRAWPADKALYAATKAGLEVLTRSWAVDLAPHGARAVAVAPGAIVTPMGDDLPPDELARLREWQLAHIPMGRLGRPEEVAWAITRLASPQASYLTGVVLPVDGGAVIG